MVDYTETEPYCDMELSEDAKSLLENGVLLDPKLDLATLDKADALAVKMSHSNDYSWLQQGREGERNADTGD